MTIQHNTLQNLSLLSLQRDTIPKKIGPNYERGYAEFIITSFKLLAQYAPEDCLSLDGRVIDFKYKEDVVNKCLKAFFKTISIKEYIEKKEGELVSFCKRIPIDELQNLMNSDEFKQLTVDNKVARLKLFFENNQDLIDQVQELNLSNLGLTRIPEELNLFRNVGWLNLSNNNFAVLPNNFAAELPLLRTLDLGNNYCLELPEGFLERNNQIVFLKLPLLLNYQERYANHPSLIIRKAYLAIKIISKNILHMPQSYREFLLIFMSIIVIMFMTPIMRIKKTDPMESPSELINSSYFKDKITNTNFYYLMFGNIVLYGSELLHRFYLATIIKKRFV
ncbi:MAG: hypothetical protein K1060chlam5_00854 [Candidatus Anoxychlamydiales bacterium]|nr:hypothetical protein [Candidatus Anoxychlamydiales bacterium]